MAFLPFSRFIISIMEENDQIWPANGGYGNEASFTFYETNS